MTTRLRSPTKTDVDKREGYPQPISYKKLRKDRVSIELGQNTALSCAVLLFVVKNITDV